MLEFKIIEELTPNPKLLELIKNYAHKTKKGKVVDNKKIKKNYC